MVELPTLRDVVVTLILAPTLIAVDILAVAGRRDVLSVPELMFDAFAANVVAFEKAASATVLLYARKSAAVLPPT